MIFAVLFVVAFLIGLVVYQVSEKWLVAVLVSMGLFVVTTLADTTASENWGITFIFGLPIVFVASLFGAYVVQLRRGEDELIDADSEQSNEESFNSQPSRPESSSVDGSTLGNNSAQRNKEKGVDE